MTAVTTIQEANSELTLRLRQQELAAEFAQFSLGADQLQPVLHEACLVASRGMECSLAKVLEFLPDENEFIMRAGVGWHPGSVGHARLGADLASPAGYAFQTGQPVLSNHLAEETRFRTPQLLVEHGVHRAFNVLVQTPEWRFGVLEVDSPDERDFTLTDTAFLQTLAATLAQAIVKQQRHDELRASRAFAQGVLEASPDCVKVLSREGTLRFMNRKGLEMNDVASFDQVRGTEYAALWPIEEQAAVREAVRQAAAGQASRFEGFCPTQQGRPRWFELYLSPFQEGPDELPKIVGISRDISERRLAEQALRDSEERLQLALTAAHLGTWDLDLVQDTSVRSPEHDRMFGYEERHETWGKGTAERHVLDEDKPIYRDGFVRALKTGFLAFEVRVRGQDGMVRWIAPQGRVHYDEAGTPVRIVGVIAEITERKKAELALSRLNADLEQQVIDRTLERGRTWQVSPDLLSVLDLETGIYEHVNPAWAATFGIPIQEIEGRPFADFVHPDDLEASKAAFNQTRTGVPVLHFENRYPHRDGSHRILSWVAVPSNGKLYSRARDVTEEKAQTEALRLTETRAAAYFNSSEDYLLLVRIGGDDVIRFEDVNPACERVMGLVRADVIGRAVDEFLPSNSVRDIYEYAKACLDTGQSRSYNAPRAYTQGRESIIQARVVLVERFGDGGGLVLISGHDVTEQRRIEEALRQSQKMEAVGQLTGGLAHDFNNLLTGVTGSLELLQTRIAQGRIKDVDRYVNAAQGAARRAAALTHRLLAFSRRQTLDPKPTDVNGLVSGMVELIQRTVGPAITVESTAAGGLWPTLVDPSQLENALLNLCINARDAMPDGGKITIETGNRWLDERTARDRELPPGQYVSLCVSDTGTGMTPEVMAKAFDPFFTTKPIGQGTGLGLSMIYGFARQSGGQVRIYSEVGQGAMVCLYLPRHLGAADMPELTPELADAPRAEAGQTVLVVDDEPTVRMLVTEVLEDLGYRAIEAADGAAGLQVLQSDARVDLLVTDVGLPGGMNGRQVADAARVARPELKVLFITGYAENAVVSHGHLDPGMHILTKPFAMEALASRIKGLISP